MALWGFELHDGATGGLVLDENEYGKHVADAALKVALGADVRKISIDKRGLTHDVFDHRKLEEAGISEDQLPGGSVVTHMPVSIMDQHRAFVIAVLIAIVFLVAAIVLLAVNAIHRRNAEQARLRIERDAREQMQRFYQETILSVTGGRLGMCDAAQLEPLLNSAVVRAVVSEPDDVPVARGAVRRFCGSEGLVGRELDGFVVGVGEAINNAVKHAPRGVVRAGRDDSEVWAAVSDSGPGIDSLLLPRVAVEPGFTTKGSLGMGYTIML